MSLAAPAPEVGASDATGVLIAGASDQNVLPPNPDALPKIDLFPIFYGFCQRSPQLCPANFQDCARSAFSYHVGTFFAHSRNFLQSASSDIDNGVWQMTTAQPLRERGYGVTLAEAAAEAKARIQHANHIYTNADAARLHGGN